MSRLKERKAVLKYLFKELSDLDRELTEADREIVVREVMLDYHKRRCDIAKDALLRLGFRESDLPWDAAQA